MTGSSVTYTVTERAVNSRIIVNEIEQFVDDIIMSSGQRWHSDSHRDLIVEAIFELLDDLGDRGLITQYDAFCDQRNNTASQMENGQFNLSIHFKQRNCLNKTKLEYVVENDTPTEDEKNVII